MKQTRPPSYDVIGMDLPHKQLFEYLLERASEDWLIEYIYKEDDSVTFDTVPDGDIVTSERFSVIIERGGGRNEFNIRVWSEVLLCPDPRETKKSVLFGELDTYYADSGCILDNPSDETVSITCPATGTVNLSDVEEDEYIERVWDVVDDAISRASHDSRESVGFL